jgi:hypothetical protein
MQGGRISWTAQQLSAYRGRLGLDLRNNKFTDELNLRRREIFKTSNYVPGI